MNANEKFLQQYPQDLEWFVDGEWISRGNREVREVVNPADGRVLGTLPIATSADLDAALSAAERALGVWSKTSAWARDVIMQRAAALIAERKELIAVLLSLEQGKTLAEARGEVDRVVETIQWCAEEGKRTYGRLLPPRQPLLTQTTFKRPIGVVAAFAPWNFPAFLVARKVAAALAAGCSMVVKPAEETPASCLALARAFADAGLPKGVLNVVFGTPAEISAHLIASPTVRKISFTGSVPVGRLLTELAARELKPATMELGGHSPVLVFDDVDVEKVATACAQFKFRNAGQVCISPSRFFVHERVHAAFVDRFTLVASSIKVGRGIDPSSQMGPLNNSRRLEAATRFVNDAHDRGAKVVTGGSRIGTRGYFFQPTVLTDVQDGSAILREEPFCPVAPIVPFSSTEEALKRANGVQYGLAAYAFTDSIRRAAEVAEGFEAGWIGVNSFTPALADAPIGGMKQSGVGYEGGPEGLDAYLQTKFLSQAAV
jgi:succinate-semialdehyde dehydrogenase/glutarate-semialdehyde dehydrogenase